MKDINNLYHSHKKRKDSLETRVVVLIFSLELEMPGVTVQSIHENIEKWKLLFEAVLATFCRYGAKVSEEVQKIAHAPCVL